MSTLDELQKTAKFGMVAQNTAIGKGAKTAKEFADAIGIGRTDPSKAVDVTAGGINPPGTADAFTAPARDTVSQDPIANPNATARPVGEGGIYSKVGAPGIGELVWDGTQMVPVSGPKVAAGVSPAPTGSTGRIPITAPRPAEPLSPAPPDASGNMRLQGSFSGGIDPNAGYKNWRTLPQNEQGGVAPAEAAPAETPNLGVNSRISGATPATYRMTPEVKELMDRMQSEANKYTFNEKYYQGMANLLASDMSGQSQFDIAKLQKMSAEDVADLTARSGFGVEQMRTSAAERIANKRLEFDAEDRRRTQDYHMGMLDVARAGKDIDYAKLALEQKKFLADFSEKHDLTSPKTYTDVLSAIGQSYNPNTGKLEGSFQYGLAVLENSGHKNPFGINVETKRSPGGVLYMAINGGPFEPADPFAKDKQAAK